MAKSQEWQRIEAGEVVAGDLVGRTRNREPERVKEVRAGATSVRLVFGRGNTIRPRKTAKLWRKIEQS